VSAKPIIHEQHHTEKKKRERARERMESNTDVGVCRVLSEANRCWGWCIL
jgi:hypothetical protein